MLKRSCADEAEHGQAVLPGQAHGQARRGAHGRQDGDAGHHRLLHQLEARPAADQQHGLGERRAAGEELAADQLVQGVVPADVLAQAQQVAAASNNAAACRPPVRSKTACAARKASGSRWMTAAVDDGPALGKGDRRADTRTASSDVLPHTPQLEEV